MRALLFACLFFGTPAFSEASWTENVLLHGEGVSRDAAKADALKIANAKNEELQETCEGQDGGEYRFSTPEIDHCGFTILTRWQCRIKFFAGCEIN